MKSSKLEPGVKYELTFLENREYHTIECWCVIVSRKKTEIVSVGIHGFLGEDKYETFQFTVIVERDGSWYAKKFEDSAHLSAKIIDYDHHNMPHIEPYEGYYNELSGLWSPIR